MILRPVNILPLAERQNLRPKNGDTVVINGGSKLYTVVQSGLKYFRVRSQDTGEMCLIHSRDIVKYTAPQQADTSGDLEFTDLYSEFTS